MRIGSLCSGAGGLDLAVEQVFGARTAWHCEINDAASKVLAHRWPGVPNHRDLTTTDWDSVEPVDILTGGYPCQPFSQAGKRKGTDDERHIWPDVREAIRRVRPRITILENVAGHRSLGFDRVLGDLAEGGMHVRWTSVRASDVGAPHQRERLFILVTDPASDGWPQFDGRPGGEAARGGWERNPARGVGRASVANSAHVGQHEWRPESTRASGGPDAAECRDGAIDLLPTPAASRSGRNRSPSPGAAIRPSLDSITDLLPTPTARLGNSRGASHPDRRKELQPKRSGELDEVVCHLLPTPNASDGTGGGQHPDRREGHSRQLIDYVLAPEKWGKYAPAIHRWESLTRSAPSPTEPNTKGNPRLNPAFSEWMMGWPAGWVTDVPGISRNDQLRIIGNGVVPQCAASALTMLLGLELAA